MFERRCRWSTADGPIRTPGMPSAECRSPLRRIVVTWENGPRGVHNPSVLFIIPRNGRRASAKALRKVCERSASVLADYLKRFISTVPRGLGGRYVPTTSSPPADVGFPHLVTIVRPFALVVQNDEHRYWAQSFTKLCRIFKSLTVLLCIVYSTIERSEQDAASMKQRNISDKSANIPSKPKQQIMRCSQCCYVMET